MSARETRDFLEALRDHKIANTRALFNQGRVEKTNRGFLINDQYGTAKVEWCDDIHHYRITRIGDSVLDKFIKGEIG